MPDIPDQPLSILFIEDNPTDFELAVRALRREGLEFSSRREEDTDGITRALSEFVPDIVISDYSLPGFDGLHALRLCKSILPEVPFILHTAALQDESAIFCIRAGADDYVLKQHLAHLPFAVQNALERRRAHKAERSATSKLILLASAIEQSPVSVVITDTSGTIEYVNPKFLEVTGYSYEEALGNNPRLLKSGRQAKDFYEKLWGTIASGETWRGEFENRKKNGDSYWESATISPVRDTDGRITKFVAVKEDITEKKFAEDLAQKQAKALAQANEDLKRGVLLAEELARRAEAAANAKSEFLAVMSHELRTPLNGMLGFAELLTLSRLDAEQRESVETILESGTHLLSVVNDILDFSSIEKGTTKIEAIKLDLGEMVDSVCLAIQKAATAKGLSFRYETAPDLPRVITGDSRRIAQILLNLLGNAVKFTARGSVILRASVSSGPAGQAIDFSVEDTGPGMSPETVNILFKPFTQGDSTLHRRFEGTGLGLAISQRLAEAMDGTISVVSKPGSGSTFTFRLPILDSETVAEIPPATAGNDPAAECCGTVLVVEDDQISSALATKMLSILGYQVVLALNGQLALDAFLRQKFVAILMDMQMPVLDGIEATKTIRTLEADGSRVPIIAVTANVMPGDRERCLAAGMDDFLSKPYKMDELAAKLARTPNPRK